MAGPTDAFREEHAALMESVERLREAARRVPEMDPAERAAEIERSVEFLRGTLVPHAVAEERFLYPAVADLLGAPEATATMISDHRAIVARIDRLAAADRGDVAELQELLYGLHALLTVHFRKEEDDYLPLLEELPEEEVAAVFERMGGHGPHDHGGHPA